MSDNYTEAVICLGSNVDCRRAKIDGAIDGLGGVCEVLESTGIYETEADNHTDAPFFNLVMRCRCTLSLDEMLACCKELEARAGRLSESKATGIMPLDVDIIVWDGRVIDPRQYAKPYFTLGYKRLQTADVR